MMWTSAAMADAAPIFQVPFSIQPPTKDINQTLGNAIFAPMNAGTLGLTADTAGNAVLIHKSMLGTKVRTIPQQWIPNLRVGLLKGKEWCAATQGQRVAIEKKIADYLLPQSEKTGTGLSLVFTVNDRGTCSVKVIGVTTGNAQEVAYVDPDDLAKLADMLPQVGAQSGAVQRDITHRQQIYDSLK
jgi:hypothetical protein